MFTVASEEKLNHFVSLTFTLLGPATFSHMFSPAPGSCLLRCWRHLEPLTEHLLKELRATESSEAELIKLSVFIHDLVTKPWSSDCPQV